MKALLDNKWMVLTGILLVVCLVLVINLILGIGYEMYLESLTINERIDLMKNGDMTLEEKLNLFR